MVRKRKSKASDDDNGLDAWIDRESVNQGNGCQLCEPKVLAELQKMEKRLRHKKKRVAMRAIWRRLTELKLINFSAERLSKYLQRACHLKFYKFLKGLE